MSMTRDKIEEAMAEATRFLQAADEALAKLDQEVADRDDRYASAAAQGYAYAVDHDPGPKPSDYSYGSAATGTLRRRSMDLTRALSKLRTP
ncbi:hypothetical protein SEA_VROOMVROOM_63 [Arthrobacter phage VroomVroom]|uniref:Uncharacterized protein n=1 Tax=Arthrobacter phage VroomVroom TaxID=3049371 RepID=A0AA49F9V3_9CAUD|nr:hypothetical protein SEA_VROOMVROOM_63 [Arthrobacter phage VroomVroom]